MIQENKYTVGGVAERGSAIYKEWEAKHSSSRGIVAEINSAAKNLKSKEKTKIVEALALILALDTRIKEKYKSLFKRIFFCFSKRREANALKHIEEILFIPDRSGNVRDKIEAVLRKVNGEYEAEELDGNGGGANGGKLSGKSDPATEQNGIKSEFDEPSESLLTDVLTEQKNKKQASFIDEVIMDNMVRSKRAMIGYDLASDASDGTQSALYKDSDKSVAGREQLSVDDLKISDRSPIPQTEISDPKRAELKSPVANRK